MAYRSNHSCPGEIFCMALLGLIAVVFVSSLSDVPAGMQNMLVMVLTFSLIGLIVPILYWIYKAVGGSRPVGYNPWAPKRYSGGPEPIHGSIDPWHLQDVPVEAAPSEPDKPARTCPGCGRAIQDADATACPYCSRFLT
nr:hypothetical protein [Candidatus Sigynarchaeota archaeon]